jgi:hypothetical protein
MTYRTGTRDGEVNLKDKVGLICRDQTRQIPAILKKSLLASVREHSLTLGSVTVTEVP